MGYGPLRHGFFFTKPVADKVLAVEKLASRVRWWWMRDATLVYHVYEGGLAGPMFPQDHDFEGSGFLEQHHCVEVK